MSRKFRINGDVPGTGLEKDVEADFYELRGDFFEFVKWSTNSESDAVVYSVRADQVLTIESVE